MFEIVWTLNDLEWERAMKAREEHAPHSQYDSQRRALYYLLNGDFDIRSDGDRLYGTGGPVNISLLDFAVFVARALGSSVSKGDLTFDQLDDDRHIVFEFSAPMVRISANDGEAVLEVPIEEVSDGLRRFLASLVHAIDQRAPCVFDWSCMAPLIPYRSAS